MLGWKKEEVDVFLAQVRKEMVSRKIHGWMKGYVSSLFPFFSSDEGLLLTLFC